MEMKRPMTTGIRVSCWLTPGCCAKNAFTPGNLAGAHIDKEDVGQFGRSGLMQVAQKTLLHEIDREDEHDARAQRRQHRGRLIAGAVEIGQAVAQRRRQMQARAIEKEAQRAQSYRGQHQQNHERQREQQTQTTRRLWENR